MTLSKKCFGAVLVGLLCYGTVQKTACMRILGPTKEQELYVLLTLTDQEVLARFKKKLEDERKLEEKEKTYRGRRPVLKPWDTAQTFANISWDIRRALQEDPFCLKQAKKVLHRFIKISNNVQAHLFTAINKNSPYGVHKAILKGANVNEKNGDNKMPWELTKNYRVKYLLLSRGATTTDMPPAPTGDDQESNDGDYDSGEDCEFFQNIDYWKNLQSNQQADTKRIEWLTDEHNLCNIIPYTFNVRMLSNILANLTRGGQKKLAKTFAKQVGNKNAPYHTVYLLRDIKFVEQQIFTALCLENTRNQKNLCGTA
jgi:hypothetical protein